MTVTELKEKARSIQHNFRLIKSAANDKIIDAALDGDTAKVSAFEARLKKANKMEEDCLALLRKAAVKPDVIEGVRSDLEMVTKKMRGLASNLKKAAEVAKALEGATALLDTSLKTGVVLFR